MGFHGEASVKPRAGEEMLRMTSHEGVEQSKKAILSGMIREQGLTSEILGRYKDALNRLFESVSN